MTNPLDEAELAQLVHYRKLNMMSRPAKTYTRRDYGFDRRDPAEEAHQATSALTIESYVIELRFLMSWQSAIRSTSTSRSSRGLCHRVSRAVHEPGMLFTA